MMKLDVGLYETGRRDFLLEKLVNEIYESENSEFDSFFNAQKENFILFYFNFHI